MKSEIDAFMEKEDIDVIWVTGTGMHNPYMVYLLGEPCHITRGDIIKKHGEAGIVFTNDMEREEAAKSGLQSRSYNQYRYRDLLTQAQNDELKASVLMYEKIFRDMDIKTGNVAIFGEIDWGRGAILIQKLQSNFPDIHFLGSGRENVLTEAMITKDENEIAHIKKMGSLTGKVVANTADFLCSHKAEHDYLIKKDDSPLRVGDVKKQIQLWLAENGMEAPEGTIFAIGRDAGIPHSAGNNRDIIQLGKSIVFDIFPCEAGGGYCYDFTRTWCLGYAPDNVVKAYEDVLVISRQLQNEVRVDIPFYQYQNQVNEYFESKGHPTLRNAPDTQKGYVHSVGHGVGLKVQERPFCGVSMVLSDKLIENSIFTIEPGLYYPEDGFGVRIEDTFQIKTGEKIKPLADYPYDLVLPVH